VISKLQYIYFPNVLLPINIIRVIQSTMMGWVGHTARMGEMRSAYDILIGKPERKRPHGNSRSVLEYNFKWS
jgi:hypothetical protein